jgi:hypothetical protein
MDNQNNPQPEPQTPTQPTEPTTYGPAPQMEPAPMQPVGQPIATQTPQPATAYQEPISQQQPQFAQPAPTPQPVQAQQPAYAPANTATQQPVNNPGKTLIIIGFIMSFVFLAPIGLVLSIIGVVKSKKAGAKYGLGIAGIVLNIFSLIMMFLIWINVASYSGLIDKANESYQQAKDRQDSYSNYR